MNTPYEPPKLPYIMADLVSCAQVAPFTAQRRVLKRGLHIEVTCEKNTYHLRIWRDGVLPSPDEWTRVLNAWPWPTHVLPSVSLMATPPFMHGRIKAEEVIQEKFF